MAQAPGNNQQALGALLTGDRVPKGQIPAQARAAIIAAVFAGQPHTKVAKDFNVSSPAVSRLVKRFRETGDLSIRPRSGRPKKQPVREVGAQGEVTMHELVAISGPSEAAMKHIKSLKAALQVRGMGKHQETKMRKMMAEMGYHRRTEENRGAAGSSTGSSTTEESRAEEHQAEETSTATSD